MPVANWTVQINRRPDEVFRYLSDISRHGEWSPKTYKVQALTDGPVAVGSRFRSEGWLPRSPNHVNEFEITALEPPSRLAYSAYDEGQVFKNDFRLTPRNGGTEVARTLDMPKPPGFAGVIFPLIPAGVVKPGVQKGLSMLKANLEQGKA